MKKAIAVPIAALLLLLFSGMALAESVPLDSAHFPDGAFRAYLSETFDTDGSGALSGDERLAVTELHVQNKGIASLSGLGYFPNLESLMCWQNRLTHLDVSGNPALRELYCGNNRLTSLDLSACPGLADLSCYGNSLTSLNLSANPALEYLTCKNNCLTSLDLSGNSKLKMVESEGNQRSMEAPGGMIPLSMLPSFDVSRSSNWQGGIIGQERLTVPASGQVTYSYDCGRGFQTTITLHVTVPQAPSPQPEKKPAYTFGGFSFNGQEAAGRLVHDVSTPEAGQLTVRVTFYIEGSYYMAASAEVEADGSFSVEGVGPILYITAVASGTGQDGAPQIFHAAELFVQ